MAAIDKNPRQPVPLQDIYEALQTQPFVTSYHLQPWRTGGQPRYQCWTRRYLTTLIRERRIKRVGHGLYSLKSD